MMRLKLRRFVDKAFSVGGWSALGVVAISLMIILGPVLWRGAGAVFFKGTSEHRRMLFEEFNVGDEDAVHAETKARERTLAPVWAALKEFEEVDLKQAKGAERKRLREDVAEFKRLLRKVVGPLPGEAVPVLARERFGQARWDGAQRAIHDLLNVEEWVYPTDEAGNPLPGVLKVTPRKAVFEGTSLAAVFDTLEADVVKALQPEFTVFWRFFTLESRDSHFFGGIAAELMGTLWLAIGALLVAVPIGVLAAVYLAIFAKDGWIVGTIRLCIGALAGVPSIVFGLFGLAFFVMTMRVSEGRSVLAGALTLGVLVLPTVIRTAEEAVRAVPHGYVEAALSLGASRWRAVWSVVVPAALPGILTGVVIGLGRAAGETAPIIFTAAVSLGGLVGITEVLSRPTPALSWGIYNLVSEHEAATAVAHVQYGMAASLVLLVLLLNLGAVWLRARVGRRLRG